MGEPPKSNDPPEPAKQAADESANGFWARIKDHKVLQWGLAYAGAALAIADGEGLMAHAFAWPDSVGRIVVAVLLLGLPVALTISWYHGHRGLQRVTGMELAIVAILVVIGAGLLAVLVRTPPRNGGPALSPATAHARQPDAAAASLPVSRNSIAVLPFANMSGDPGQEYFCDGVSEEILNVLVRNPDMRVIGRGSSFSFKGGDDDLRTIGRRLGVYQLLEGSVRRQGNRVRISAHLVRASDGVELWSQSFDRDLSDILSVQSEIADAIATKFAAKPMHASGTAQPMTRNIAAYDAYLKALNEYRASGTGPERAQRFFDDANKAVTLDPQFAEAWALLSEAYIWREEAAPPETGFRPATLEQAESAALHALELNPRSAGGYFALGYLRWMEASWTAAEDDLRKAWLREPNNPKFNVYLGELLLNAGRVKEATPILRRAYAADPLIPGALVDLSFALFVQDPRSAEARMLMDRAVALNPQRLASRMIRIILSLGRHDLDLAIDDQHEIDRQASSKASRKFGEDLTAVAHDPKALRSHLHSAAKQSASLELDNILLFPWAIANGDDAFAIDDVVLRTPAQIQAHAWFWVTYMAPQFSPIRKDPRVKGFLEQAKYVDHWRARGWPDNCRPLGKDDFACW